jgi:hypothetical protein
VYDPHGVITTIRPVYKHMPNLVVERTTNLESWEEVKQIISLNLDLYRRMGVFFH